MQGHRAGNEYKNDNTQSIMLRTNDRQVTPMRSIERHPNTDEMKQRVRRPMQ